MLLRLSTYTEREYIHMEQALKNELMVYINGKLFHLDIPSEVFLVLRNMYVFSFEGLLPHYKYFAILIVYLFIPLKLISPVRTAFSFPKLSLTIRSPASDKEIQVTISSVLYVINFACFPKILE